MDTLLQDLRYGLRLLAQRPAFTTVAVLSLALGIGANSTIFTLVDALLLRSLPVAAPDRLVAVYTADEKNPGAAPLSHLNWKDLREQNRVFSGVLGYDWLPLSVGADRGGEAEVVFGQLVSGNYFDLLGVKAARGRTFARDEDREGAGQAVVVVSDGFWRRRLGGDPDAVGRTIVLNNHPFTVIGVAPREFSGLDIGAQPALWAPMAVNRELRPAELNWYNQRRGLFVFTMARLKPGVALPRAQAEVKALFARLQRDFPVENRGRTAQLVPLAQAGLNPNLRGGVVAVSALLAAVVGLVLLIACINVANLLLARAAARRKEIAVRLSIGAGRPRLVRQLLTESVLLSLLGGAAGLALVAWASRALLLLLPAIPFPLHLDLGLNGRVLAFTFLLSLATGVLFGLAPALAASRPELVPALKSEVAPSGAGARRLTGRNLLVAGQVALSLVALIAAGLFLRGLGAATRADTGFDAERLATVGYDLGLQGYSQERGEAFDRELLARIGALPGVASATVAQAGPLQASYFRSVFLEGREGEGNGTLIQVNSVGPRYFATVGIPVVRGRALDERDRQGSLRAVVVNEAMAERFWPGASAVGQRFHFFGEEPVEVVGVARNAIYNNPGEDPQPYVYLPLGQWWSGTQALVVRAAGEPAALLPPVEREVRALDKQLALVGVSTVAHTLHEGLWAPRAGASLLGLFGLLALALATVGIYGVMSFAVAQRAREIGIRMAMGARRNDVLALVLRQGMGVVGLGLAAGLLLAFAATRLVANMLFGVSPTDPLAFGVTSLILAAVALAANFLPARRATAVDPVVVLRQA
jgi:putative ABC transport system permease protein